MIVLTPLDGSCFPSRILSFSGKVTAWLDCHDDGQVLGQPGGAASFCGIGIEEFENSQEGSVLYLGWAEPGCDLGGGRCLTVHVFSILCLPGLFY